MKNIPALLTVPEVAQKLDCSEQHIRSLLREGRLDGKLMGRQWVVNPGVVARLSRDARMEINPKDHPRARRPLPRIKALSFFSGAMGLDLGLESVGINVILACESDKACRKTIEANRPELALVGDIWDYSACKIREIAGLTSGEDIECIVGGPPCQAFSTAGARVDLGMREATLF